MADDATPESAPDPAGAAAPKHHDAIVIEGEAAELHAAESEPPANQAAEDAAPAEPPPEEAVEWPSSLLGPSDAAEPRRTSSAAFVWGIAGAVVGAAAALGAAWWLDPGAEPLRDLTARESTLEASVAEQSAAAKTVASRLDALEAAQRDFAKTAALAAVDKRLAKLESASVEPETIAAAQAEAHAAREDAAKALAQAAAAANASEKPAPPTAAGPDPRISELEADEEALGDRIAKLEAALAAAKADPRIGKLEADETALGDRIAKLEAALAAPKTESRAAPTEVAPKSDAAGQAVATLALEQRLRAGEPFEAEWDALSRLGADSAALAALAPLAKSGAPTAAALAKSFARIAPDLVAATNPEPADGVVDRMLGQIRKLVRIHAVGEVAGEDPAALVSQVEAALARGEVASALEIYARLPEAARKAGADWAKAATARAAAEAAARSLRDNAVGRLAAARN